MAGAKYQIFISSTYEDLVAERETVIRAVLEMGHIPVGMEMFSAADEEQWQIIARHIDESDYYVVIVAHRYGSVTTEGISYTRKEYEYARSQGVPTLGFLIDDAASWPGDRVDKDVEAVLLNDFKSLVKQRPVSFWSTPEDLHGKFAVALGKAFTAHPREGWVRASAATGPEVTGELIRLSVENAKLRGELEEAERSAASDRAKEIRQTIDKLSAVKKSPSYRYTRSGEWQNDSEVSLFWIFFQLAPELMVETSLDAAASTLAMNLRVDRSRSWDIVAMNQMSNLFADLMTLDLVQPSTRKHTVKDEHEYWSLTPFGLDVLKSLRKLLLDSKPLEEPTNGDTADAGLGDEGQNDDDEPF